MIVESIKKMCAAKLDREIKDIDIFYTLCYTAMLRICLFCSPKVLLSSNPGDTQRIEYIGSLRYPIEPSRLDEHLDIDDALCLAVVSFVCSDIATDRGLKNDFAADAMNIVNNYEANRLREANTIAKKQQKGAL